MRPVRDTGSVRKAFIEISERMGSVAPEKIVHLNVSHPLQ
jgi:hypothetical protein